MNWVQYAWTLIAGMFLALGLVQMLVWVRRRGERQYLIYAVFALGSAIGSLGELNALFAQDAAQYARALSSEHLGMGVALLCMPWFVRVRFGAGRRWLLWTATALRAVIVAISVLSATTINLSHLQLRPVELLGVTVAMPVGSFNPLVLLAHLHLLCMIAFFADTIVELRRRNDREEYERGLRICGGLIAFVLLAGGQTVLVTYGLLHMPYLITPPFLLPILLLSYELGADLLTTRLARARLWQSELLLRESEERWEIAGQIAGIAPWSWNAGDNVLTLSPKAREMFGIERAGPTILQDWLARIHPEDAARIQAGVRNNLREGSSFERDYRMLMPNGQVRWIASRGSIERGPDGGVLSMRGVSFDLSRIRRADAMFRAALEAAPDAIFLVDDEGRIQLANARASLMFGYSNPELMELSLDALIPGWRFEPERRSSESPRVPPAVECRAPSREFTARRHGGAPLPVELALRPLEGGLTLASAGDITERLNAEQESAQHRTELAHLSRVAVLGEMSASLAHELNQPLTAIVANAQAAQRFLQMGPGNEQELDEALRDIAASGNRAGEVIRRLRAMLKKEEMQRTPLDVNQLIHEVLQLYRSDLINRGVVVRADLDYGLPAVVGDRVQLQQVLLNLVINACEAMADVAGERRLCICSRRLPGDELEFAVCDVGPGIESTRLEQVFDPFVTTKASGMGLGLSVCKTIVKSHGGRIWASNTDDAGASFHVALPAMAEAASPHAATAELHRS